MNAISILKNCFIQIEIKINFGLNEKLIWCNIKQTIRGKDYGNGI